MQHEADGGEDVRSQTMRISNDVRAEFHDASNDVLQVLYITKYMVRIAKNISSFYMRISTFVRKFWLVRKESYRCHLCNFYRYQKGACILRDGEIFETYQFTEITQAFEGIFFALSREKVAYDWERAEEEIRGVDLGEVSTWKGLALVSADNSSASKEGVMHKARWCAKFADKVRQAKNFPDGDASKLRKKLSY